MNTVAIIQARMGSSRLPGKVLADIAGQPMLAHVVGRVRQARTLDKLSVATSTAPSDDAIMALCADLGIPCVRGSEADVLDRYFQAAQQMSADVVVRITADCPLIDPGVIDAVVEGFRNGGFDYVSNIDPPTYPDGLDTEVFSFDALKRAWTEARLPSEREHVTPYLRNHPERFRSANIIHGVDLSSYRWTVDELDDLAFVRAVVSALGRSPFNMQDVCELLAHNPQICAINAGHVRNEGYLASLRAA